MPSEFELIQQLANAQSIQRDEVVLGIGDDAAVLDIPEGHELVVSTDTLNVGVHFPKDTSAQNIGYKSLAVNLSDLAAMGAEPLAVNLSLSLPDSDTQWIKDFSEGFFSLAAIHNIQLIGGDTTRGPLSISVTIFGMVSKGQAIRRSTAKVGDSIYVTGTLGDAGAALLGLMGELKLTGHQQQVFNERLNRPQPRVATGMALRGVASSCIDISDGLTADLGHILEQSNLGATLYADQLPVSSVYKEIFDLAGGWHLPLNAGDDYELCFTIAEANHPELEAAMSSIDVPVTWIGTIESNAGLRLFMPDATTQTIEPMGYDHFKS